MKINNKNLYFFFCFYWSAITFEPTISAATSVAHRGTSEACFNLFSYLLNDALRHMPHRTNTTSNLITTADIQQ